MKKLFEVFLEDLRLLSNILRWKEYWMVVGVSLSILGVWLLFWVSLYLQTPWNAVFMWGVIIALALIAPRK